MINTLIRFVVILLLLGGVPGKVLSAESTSFVLREGSELRSTSFLVRSAPPQIATPTATETETEEEPEPAPSSSGPEVNPTPSPSPSQHAVSSGGSSRRSSESTETTNNPEGVAPLLLQVVPVERAMKGGGRGGRGGVARELAEVEVEVREATIAAEPRAPLYTLRRGTHILLDTAPRIKRSLGGYRDAWNRDGAILISGTRNVLRNERLQRMILPSFLIIAVLTFCLALLIFGNALIRLAFIGISASVLLISSVPSAHAESSVPRKQVYSAYLLEQDGTPITTAHAVRFSYWRDGNLRDSDVTEEGEINEAAPSYVGWREVHAVTPEESGYFAVTLGSQTPLPTFEDLSLDALQHLFLQVEVKPDGLPGVSYELLDFNPNDETLDRSPLTSVMFAMNADRLDLREIGEGAGDIPVLGEGGVFFSSQIPGGTESDYFTIDADSSGENVELRFGDALGTALSYSENRFTFTDDLAIKGDFTVEGDADLKGNVNVAGSQFVWGSAVFGGTVTLGGVRYTFPETSGLPGQVLAIDGSGSLVWKDDDDEVNPSGIMEEDADARYLKTAGGTVSGDLSVLSTLSVGELTALSVAVFPNFLSCEILRTDEEGRLSCGVLPVPEDPQPFTPSFVLKPTDEAVAGDDGLQNDDHLTFAVGPNETWIYEIRLIGQSPRITDIQFAIAAPEGSACAYSIHANQHESSHTTCGESSGRVQGTGGNSPYRIDGSVVAGSNGGSVILQWAPNHGIRDREAIIRAGSWMKMYRVE